MKKILFLLLPLVLFAACSKQPAKTYTLEGTATGFAEGDTLFLTEDLMNGLPTDTIIIGADGKFTVIGQADSVLMCAIYEPGNPQNMVQFFSEPASIRIEMTKDPGHAKVSGSIANDSLQAMIESIMPYADRISHLMDSLFTISGEASDEAKWALRERIEQLYTEQTRKVVETAERNVDNELGYYLVTHYDCPDPVLNQRLQALIDQMPAAFQQRPEVVRMRQADQVVDFKMPTPEGGELSLMDDLKAIGITNVFDAEKADLSGISSAQTYIGSAVHKATIDFSNDGIKASAATAMGGMGDGGGGFEYYWEVPVKRIDLTFDRPFMYVIRDKDTGEVWFTGTVYQPSAPIEPKW